MQDDQGQLNLEAVRFQLVDTTPFVTEQNEFIPVAADEPDTEPPARVLSVVTDAPATVRPIPRSTYEADGDALWDLVDKKRELTTRPEISDDLRGRLAESAEFDRMRAQLRSPKPLRPRLQTQRQAG